MENGMVPDDNIEFSSRLSDILGLGRLQGEPWIPRENALQHLQIMFNMPFDLSSLAIQGAPDGSRVTSFLVKYMVIPDPWLTVTGLDNESPYVSSY